MQPSQILSRQDQVVFFVREKGDYNQTPAIAFKKLIELFGGEEKLNAIHCIFYGMGLSNPKVTKSEECLFDACMSTDSSMFLPNVEDVKEKVIKGGRFAVFTHEGPYSDLATTCNQIFHEWLPKSNERLATEPMFCEYLDFLNKSSETKNVTRIYIPLQEVIV